MTPVDFLGYAASATVLATFCMSTMTPLRVTAILSNILFGLFGLWAHIYPVMLLHLILFPVNIVRLVQIRYVVRGISQNVDLSMESILPLMVHRRFRAGETLMRRGEQADRLFYLIDGQVEVLEIGVFARHQQRIATVVCLSDCELYELSASKAKALYYQDPSFGYAVLQTIIARLIENMQPANPIPANSHASDKAL
jgi:CRP/FNR family cyclic AMP-dependent transcriptional regulator